MLILNSFRGLKAMELTESWLVLGSRRMSTSGLVEDEGSDPYSGDRCEQRDTRLSDQRKIPAFAIQVKLPRFGREGAVEVRPFPAEKRLRASEVQGLSGEAVKGNPTTTVIPGVDESKPSLTTGRTKEGNK